jgi:hypothetical protein
MIDPKKDGAYPTLSTNSRVLISFDRRVFYEDVNDTKDAKDDL